MEPDQLFNPGRLTSIKTQQGFVSFEDQWKSATCQQCGYYGPIDDAYGQCRFFAWKSEEANHAFAYDPACPRFEPHGRPVEINNHDDD